MSELPKQPQSQEDEAKQRENKLNEELKPLLEKYQFGIGANAQLWLDKEGYVRVSGSPVLVDQKKAEEPKAEKPE